MFIFICTPVDPALTHACLQTCASKPCTECASTQGQGEHCTRFLFALCVSIPVRPRRTEGIGTGWVQWAPDDWSCWETRVSSWSWDLWHLFCLGLSGCALRGFLGLKSASLVTAGSLIAACLSLFLSAPGLVPEPAR